MDCLYQFFKPFSFVGEDKLIEKHEPTETQCSSICTHIIYIMHIYIDWQIYIQVYSSRYESMSLLQFFHCINVFNQQIA